LKTLPKLPGIACTSSFLRTRQTFPDYFGMNWDSLDKCLRDPDVMPANGCVLFFRGAEPFWQRASQTAGVFVEIWISAAEERGHAGTPFHLVFVW
jgi:Barstar (barnase inhibitor)